MYINKDRLTVMALKCAAVVMAAVLLACGCAGAYSETGTQGIVQGEAGVETTKEYMADDGSGTGSIPETGADDRPGNEQEAEAAAGTGEALSEEGSGIAVVSKYGTITSADVGNDELVIRVSGTYISDSGSSTQYSEDIIFHIKEGAALLDAAAGIPMDIGELEAGESVYVWAEDLMTLSLPAQMYLEALAANIPEDSAAPRYVVVAQLEWSSDGALLEITDQDGTVWTAYNETGGPAEGGTEDDAGAEDTEALSAADEVADMDPCNSEDSLAGHEAAVTVPFRTRQIVSLTDIAVGSRLFIYPGDGTEVYKIIVI